MSPEQMLAHIKALEAKLEAKNLTDSEI